MPRKDGKKRPLVFISHSRNLNVALQIEAALESAGFDAWLDHSNIRVGSLLGKELKQAIQRSRAVVLLWSATASRSPWVATEILTAFHLNRYIVPCMLGTAELPQALRTVYFNLRKRTPDVLARLVQQAKNAPRERNDFAGVTTYQDRELSEASLRLKLRQDEELSLMAQDNQVAARKIHAKLEVEMRAAEKRWRYDPIILSLAGFHRKNGYMLKHWDENNAGRYPKDPLLGEGRQRFLETLLVSPVDFNSLNGLGNILFFDAELVAAELFVEKAIECAAAQGVDYPQAKSDLQLIRNRMGKK